jgi:excinuclease ABC subunit A
MADRLVVRGAREHNLRDVSLDLPRDKLIVFTGLSGSGKSSLAFDTIYAEGQRRYVESLSAYARQFLGQMDKPDVDFIEGLSPAISIDQKSASRNPRSTVGTITEVYDYLRLLYARIGHPHCPRCGRPVARQTPQQIVDRVLELPNGTKFQVLAPVVRGRKGEYSTLLDDFAKQGFARVRVDGVPLELSDRAEVALARYETHTIEVVVARLVRRDGIRQRLTESIETALEMTGGTAEVLVMGATEDSDASEEGITFSQHLACTHCGISFEEPAPRSFSFNSPYGACPTCAGLGTKFEVDPELVVPDESLSLAEGALAPWAGARSEYFSGLQSGVAALGGFSDTAPWKSLKAKDKKLVLYGSGTKPVHVTYKNRFGRTRSYEALFEGIVPWLQRRHGEAESDWSREQIEQYMREVDCPACKGARLKPESLAVTVGGRNIYELCSLSIGNAVEAMGTLELSDREHMIADRVFKEVRERMQFLLDVGLDYLSLARSAGTLSGGEAQRIRLASQIGSGLVGVLYVLDEPSIGLHQRDNQRLIGTLERLRNLGNTVIVVEHDEETIRAADYVVDIGLRGPCRPGQREGRPPHQQGVDHRAVPLGQALHTRSRP